MPLGIGRASQYAGWWTGTPKMTTTINATLSQGTPWLVTPRYYQDNSATGYQNANQGAANSPTTGQITTTGLTNSAASTTALTIRFGSSYLSTAPSGTSGATWYNRFSSGGTSYFPNIGFTKDSSGQYRINITPLDTFQGSAVINNFDSLRNTWLSFVIGMSTTSSSFASWAGTGTDTYYTRVCVYNVETGQLLQTSDLTVGGSSLTKDFSQNWYFDYSSSYGYQPFWYTQNAEWNLYARTDWDLASIWHGWDVLDPSVYYSQLSGASLSPTVGGLNSTFMCQFTGAGTRTSGDDGFNITIGGNGSRMPSDVVWTADTNQGTSTNSSSLVSF